MDYKYIPEGYHSITPYLILNNAADAIDFYQKAFDAVEQGRLDMPNGKIGYAVIKIGNSLIMLADEFPEMGYKGPKTLGGSHVGLHLFVEDADIAFAKAITAGAKQITPVTNMFFGDRMGRVEDPFGYIWALATRVENISHEELLKRFKQTYSG